MKPTSPNKHKDTSRMRMAAKKLASLDARADQLLTFAMQQAKKAKTWTELNNRVFGIGGKATELFPEQGDRAALVKLPQYKKITELIRKLPTGPVAKVTAMEAATARSPSEYSGKLVVRLPKTVHAALAAEAEEEHVSLNQLILAKLTIQLRGFVQL
jgi:hypothetical protein